MQVWCLTVGVSCAYSNEDGGQPQEIAPTNLIFRFSNIRFFLVSGDNFRDFKEFTCTIGGVLQNCLAIAVGF